MFVTAEKKSLTKSNQENTSKQVRQASSLEKPTKNHLIPQKTNDTGIPDKMKMRFENATGLSFNDVKVHYNSGKPAQLQALAYTQGNQIYLAPRQEKHLGHELGHVIQQKQGRVNPTTTFNGMPINDEPKFEREADLLSTVSTSSRPMFSKFSTLTNSNVIQGMKSTKPQKKQAKQAQQAAFRDELFGTVKSIAEEVASVTTTTPLDSKKIVFAEQNFIDRHIKGTERGATTISLSNLKYGLDTANHEKEETDGRNYVMYIKVDAGPGLYVDLLGEVYEDGTVHLFHLESSQ